MSVFMSHSAVGGADPSSAALHFCLDEFAKLPKRKRDPSGHAEGTFTSRADVGLAVMVPIPLVYVLPSLSLPDQSIVPGPSAQRHQRTRRTGSRQLATLEAFHVSLAERQKRLGHALDASGGHLIPQGEIR